MAAVHRRIHGKGPYQQEEYKAGEAGIYPGMLVNINAAGNAIKHAVAEVQACVVIAAEDALQGNTVSDVYASGNTVICIVPGKGAVVNVLVESGQNIAIGDYLCSAGNGKWFEQAAPTSGVFSGGMMLQAVESSDGVLGDDTLIACRVL